VGDEQVGVPHAVRAPDGADRGDDILAEQGVDIPAEQDIDIPAEQDIDIPAEQDIDIDQVRSELALSAAALGSFDWDIVQDRLQWDERLCRIFGREPAELSGSGSSFWDMVLPEDAAEVADAMQRAFDQRSELVSEHRIVRPDGSVRWVDVRGRMFAGPDGAPVRMLGVARDSTLERARNLTRPEQARRVVAYSQALAEADTVSDVIEVVATMVLPAFGATGLLVSLADSGKLRLAGHSGYGLPAIEVLEGLAIDADSPSAEVLRTRVPLFFSSLPAYLERYPQTREEVAFTGKRAWAFAPLTVSGRALGSLTISFDQPREVTAEERLLIVSLAALLGQMLDRARLRDAERELASELQRGLLPRALAQAPELASAARYLPATDGMQVGGDWYDIIRLSADRMGLVIGDVQGHNVHAASTMGQLRNALRAYAAEGHDAVSVVSRSNRLMADTDPDAFATCCYVEIDLRRGRAFVISAGHPPPVVRSASGRTRVLEVAVGLPLGVDPDEIYVAEPVHLFPGDALVLFTDGLVEDSRTPMDTGLALVAGQVRSGDVADLEVFADRLMSRQVSAQHRPDDIALLVVRYDGLDVTQRPRRVTTVIDRGDPLAARSARQFIARVLGEWDLIDQRDAVMLLVSEVVTSALRDTPGGVDLTVIRRPGLLRVEVSDDTGTGARTRVDGQLHEPIAGISLLSGFSDRWGTAPHGAGKTVWFELDDV
jgi:PAS domain S-box-containing protein